ncbi:TIGR03617 family F420-dependent LLM class oxidoreductase [Pseudonocardia acidicola]|uniref:TIGR03617 family F420-dependent LLM class oxidoreductase n=1 Tax=Pseudonocardia acidicola TaxID=2724939 RepID=A0ABX1SJZ6_9PSEU|nr:TIGR03617 family F420-dependent LLM class oxidoreductase [Pseudonocardia acidicola]NMI00595.1 TIGR03617 family F420-dependent LLM class oxidoreductase [Pseudonocardia acidicola]
MRVETHLPLGKVDPGIRAAEISLDLPTVGAQAELVERLGFDGLVLTETKEDPFVVMAVGADRTERLRLTTAVAIAFPRSPTVTAMTAWTLARLSRGRFTLGLGTQVKGHIERRYGMHWSAPGPWIREYVDAVRAVWRTWQEGVPLDHHGEHYRLCLMNPLFDPGPIEHPDIPVHLAAVRPGMARIGGQVADGVRPHPICTRAYLVDVLRPAVDDGARSRDRDPARIEVVASPLIVTAPNEAELAKKVSDVRARISFYASTRTYRPVFSHHGWDDIAEQLSALSREQRWDEMEALVTDEMVHTIGVVGTYDEIAEKVWRRYEGVCSAVEFSLPVHGPEDHERLAEAIRAVQRGF